MTPRPGRPDRLSIDGFERVRRGAHVVLVCLARRNYPGHEHEPCPHTIIIGQPGDGTDASRAMAWDEGRRLADEHRRQWHGGMSADIFATAAKGQLERTGHIGR